MRVRTDKIVDSFSAHELMSALATLQHISDRPQTFELSFSKENMIRPGDFIRKTHNEGCGEEREDRSRQKSRRANSKYSKASTSPLQEHRFSNVTRNVPSGCKSRSLSPFDRRTSKMSSRITANKATTRINPRQSKQEIKPPSYPSSFQSKRILE
jgi:hypothetical protein